MTKGKAFMTVFGVLAAAGAVITSVLMKNRGKIEVQGQIDTKPGGMGGGKGVRGQASVNATTNRPTPGSYSR